MSLHRPMSAAVTAASILVAAAVSPASGAHIFEVAGSAGSSSGIGRGNGQQAGAIGFSTAYRLENVTFTVPLNFTTTGQPAHTVNAYLTNAIGPGTTTANLLSQDSIVVNSGQSGEFEVMNYPVLDPGTYYLMLIDFDLNFVGWQSPYVGSHTISAAPGVQLVASLAYAQESGAFPPAFQPNGDTRDASFFASIYAVRIEGDYIPEPGASVLICCSMTTVAATLRRRRANAASSGMGSDYLRMSKHHSVPKS